MDASLVKTMATLADQIHENAQLKKQLVKLEEKLILKEMKEKEQKEKIKDLETQIKVLHKQLADKKGFKLREGELNHKLKWDAFSRWSFRSIFAWGSIETTTIRKTHPT